MESCPRQQQHSQQHQLHQHLPATTTTTDAVSARSQSQSQPPPATTHATDGTNTRSQPRLQDLIRTRASAPLPPPPPAHEQLHHRQHRRNSTAHSHRTPHHRSPSQPRGLVPSGPALLSLLCQTVLAKRARHTLNKATSSSARSSARKAARSPLRLPNTDFPPSSPWRRRTFPLQRDSSNTPPTRPPGPPPGDRFANSSRTSTSTRCSAPSPSCSAPLPPHPAGPAAPLTGCSPDCRIGRWPASLGRAPATPRSSTYRACCSGGSGPATPAGGTEPSSGWWPAPSPFCSAGTTLPTSPGSDTGACACEPWAPWSKRFSPQGLGPSWLAPLRARLLRGAARGNGLERGTHNTPGPRRRVPALEPPVRPLVRRQGQLLPNRHWPRLGARRRGLPLPRTPGVHLRGARGPTAVQDVETHAPATPPLPGVRGAPRAQRLPPRGGVHRASPTEHADDDARHAEHAHATTEAFPALPRAGRNRARGGAQRVDATSRRRSDPSPLRARRPQPRLPGCGGPPPRWA